MYKCKKCKQQIKKGIPSLLLVTKTRKKEYINSEGFETVEEKLLCPICYPKEKEKLNKEEIEKPEVKLVTDLNKGYLGYKLGTRDEVIVTDGKQVGMSANPSQIAEELYEK